MQEMYHTRWSVHCEYLFFEDLCEPKLTSITPTIQPAPAMYGILPSYLLKEKY